MSKATNNSHIYPNRDVAWHEPQELHGMTVAQLNERYRFSGDSVVMFHSGEAGLILDGVDEYLAKNGDCVLDVPAYYSRFEDEFDTYVGCPTTKAGGNHVAYGITQRHLEKAVRFATGGGRFRSDDLTVTACGGDPFVVEYDGDAYLVATDQLRAFPEGYELPTWDVRGIDVAEGYATYREALARLLEHAESLGVSIDAYQEIRSGKHVFRQANGRRLYVRGSDLSKVAATPTDPDDVQRSYEIETKYDETYTVEWDDVTYGFGDEYDEWYHDGTGVVVGYQLRWEDPRTSRRVSMSGKITVDATYLVLRFVDNSSKDRSYDEMTVKRETERLGKLDPENKEWSPLAPPDR